MNRFSMLKQLREDMHGERCHAEYVNFRLTAVVVHDPNDGDFCEFVRKRFDQLSKMTGEHFLFITFISPDPEWLRFHRRHCYCFDEESMLVNKDGNLESESDTIGLLRTYFMLPANGSYLVLTRDLESTSFSIIRTDRQNCMLQLSDITEYCESGEEDADGRMYDELIHNLGVETVVCSKNFIQSLLDFSALTSRLIMDHGMGFSDSQRNYALNLIDKMRIEIPSASGVVGEEDIINAYNAISNYIYNNQRRGGENDHGHKSIVDVKCLRYLDKESRKYFNSLNVVYDLLDNTRDNDVMYDYSAIVLYIGKIFEKELNLSVLQMLRRVKGIPMPEFYNRYCEECGPVLMPDRTDINGCTNNRFLKTVPIGQLWHAYDTISGDITSSGSSYFQKMSPEFLELWHNIGLARNRAAHPSPVNQQICNSAIMNLQIFTTHFLKDLGTLKMKLSRIR